MDEIKNHYETLGIDPYATTEDVIAARDRLLAKYRNAPADPETEMEIMEITASAEVLADEKSRMEYDALYHEAFVRGARLAAINRGARRKTRDLELTVCPDCGRQYPDYGARVCIHCGARQESMRDVFSFRDFFRESVFGFSKEERMDDSLKADSIFGPPEFLDKFVKAVTWFLFTFFCAASVFVLVYLFYVLWQAGGPAVLVGFMFILPVIVFYIVYRLIIRKNLQ